MSLYTMSRFAFPLAFLLALGLQAATPSYRVTVGSEFSINAADVGMTTFGKQTKAFIQLGVKMISVPAKASKDLAGAGGAASLDCSLKKVVSPGVYSLWIETTEAKGERKTAKVTDYFAVVAPSIHKVSPPTAAAGETLTVSGSLFGSDVSVKIGKTQDAMKTCKTLTPKKEIMDPATGASLLEALVPKDVASVNGMLIEVVNRIGSDIETIDAELAADTAEVYAVTVGDIHETSVYMAKLTNFIKTFRKVHAGMTVTISGGDMLSGYPRKSYDPEWARDLYLADPNFHGIVMMELHALIPFDIIALGNHDSCLGFARFYELIAAYPQPVMVSNLFKYDNAQYTPWKDLVPYSFADDFVTVRLKGLDVGLVSTGSNYQDYWPSEDKDGYRMNSVLAERVIATIRRCALVNDMVILVTHQNDLSEIIPVYPPYTPAGMYMPNCDIYTLKDLQKVALIVGGHEHKNIFRRANYSGDNDKYALYIDKVYNPDSKLVLVKSSKFFGEYAGVVRVAWDKAAGTANSIALLSGRRGEDGKYLGCETSMMIDVDDGGMLQELNDSPWDPTVATDWWRMDDWPGTDTRVLERLESYRR